MADEHHALMQRIIETWNARDEDGFVGCYADPMLLQGGGTDGGTPVSRAQHREAARTWWQRFPDREETIDEVLSDGGPRLPPDHLEGDARIRLAWDGADGRSSPRGRPGTSTGWKDALVAEERTIMDLLGLFTQLGGVEPPGR